MSNLPWGVMLDRLGPKFTGCAASAGFAVGLFCCSFAKQNGDALSVGFFLVGFFGPAIQLPTLHLSCLFPDGGAIVMSLQAACFDGGCAVFYSAKVVASFCGVASPSRSPSRARCTRSFSPSGPARRASICPTSN